MFIVVPEEKRDAVAAAVPRYLSRAQAAELDEDLMGEGGFSLDQLMELAGLSVACAIQASFPAETTRQPPQPPPF